MLLSPTLKFYAKASAASANAWRCCSSLFVSKEANTAHLSGFVSSVSHRTLSVARANSGDHV